jgi:hypothetical protein
MKHKMLLMGESGTGKTAATATLAGVPNKKVFYVMMEDSLRVVIRRMIELYGSIPENVHWHNFQYQGASIENMINASDAVMSLDEEGQIKWRDKARKSATGFNLFLRFLKNLVDDRTGESFGSIEDLDDSWIVVFDSLTTISEMIWAEYMGGRVAVDAREYSGPQSKITTLLSAMCWQWNCSVVVTAHTEERETTRKSEVFRKYPRTLGAKLKDELGQYFDDIVLTKRLGKDQFQWDNATPMAAVKFRDLPPGLHSPDCRVIYEAIEKVQAPTPVPELKVVK